MSTQDHSSDRPCGAPLSLRLALGVALGVALGLALSACTPPPVELSINISRCLERDKKVPGAACQETLKSYYKARDGDAVGCLFIVSDEAPLQHTPVTWTAQGLAPDNPEFEFPERGQFHAELYLLKASVNTVSCERLGESVGRSCREMSDCLLRLTSLPATYSSGNVDLEFVGNNGCQLEQGLAIGFAEQRDGLDNDCDSIVDEGISMDACETGKGECKEIGIVENDINGTSLCYVSNPILPTDERCGDQLDNDCDGNVDEGFTDLGAPCVLPGVDTANYHCSSDRLSLVCVDIVDPTDALCDGINADSDERVDESYTPSNTTCEGDVCAQVGYMVCEGGRVVSTCRARTEPPLSADDATCDGYDDDCDGRVDEDAMSRRVECGVGACRVVGTEQCQGARFVEHCEPSDPAEEQCDGTIDNDCDGHIDEGFDINTNTSHCGACGNECRSVGVTQGVECGNGLCGVRCGDGERPQSTPEGLTCSCESDRELCNGRDDDCDGSVDEGLRVGEVCALEPDPSGCGRQGVWSCLDNVPVCSYRALLPRPESVEICDDLDNDCDGFRDNVAPSSTCSGACAVEVCDSLDNDCDGSVDEGLPTCSAQISSACTFGVNWGVTRTLPMNQRYTRSIPLQLTPQSSASGPLLGQVLGLGPMTAAEAPELGLQTHPIQGDTLSVVMSCNLETEWGLWMSENCMVAMSIHDSASPYNPRTCDLYEGNGSHESHCTSSSPRSNNQDPISIANNQPFFSLSFACLDSNTDSGAAPLEVARRARVMRALNLRLSTTPLAIAPNMQSCTPAPNRTATMTLSDPQQPNNTNRDEAFGTPSTAGATCQALIFSLEITP